MLHTLPTFGSNHRDSRLPPKVFLFETLQATPHLETTLEIAEHHLLCGHNVSIYFWGYDLPYNEPWGAAPFSSGESSPFARGGKLLNSNAKIHSKMPLSATEMNALKDESEQFSFTTFQQLKDFQWQGLDLGMAVVSSLVSSLKCSTFEPTQHEELIRRAALSFMFCCTSAKVVLRDTPPDVAYVFNGRFVAQKAILRVLQTAGVRTLLHERGCDTTKFALFTSPPHDRRYVQNEIKLYWADHFRKAPNRTNMEQVAVDFYMDRRTAHPKDWPSFVSEQRRDVIPSRIRERNESQLITYFTSSDDEFVAVADAFYQEGFQTQEAAIASLLRAAEEFPDYLFVIRLHPNLKVKQASESQSLLNMPIRKNVLVLPADSVVSSYQLMDESDLVISYGSTIGIEAAFANRPSLLLGSSLYDDLGSTYTAFTAEQLLDFLKDPNAWVPRNKAGAIKYGYFWGNYGIPFKHFKPASFFSGTFKGVNLEDLTQPVGTENSYRSFHFPKLKRILSAIKRRFLRVGSPSMISRNG